MEKEREEQLIKWIREASDKEQIVIWNFVNRYLKKYSSDKGQAQ